MMSLRTDRSTRGFTLVELLVVTGILAALFGVVLGTSRPKSTVPRSARDFASTLLMTQSRGLGKPEGAAIIIQADATTPRRGVIIHEANTQPPIVVPEIERGIREDDGTLSRHGDFPDLVFLKYFDGLENGYKFRYRRKVGTGRQVVSPWIGLRVRELIGPKEGAPLKAGIPVRRDSAGQSLGNAMFEPPGRTMDPHGVNLPDFDAIVIRQPSIGGNAVTLPPAVSIDLRYSGVGDDLMATHGYGQFEGLSPIAIVFDQAGRIADVIQQVGNRPITTLEHDIDAPAHTDPDHVTLDHPEWRDPVGTDALVPNQIIYLLFAETDAITADMSLSSEKSVWVSIDPLTGRIGVAANQPQPVGGTDLVAAREKARKAIALGK